MAGRETAHYSGRRRHYMSPVYSQGAEAIGVVTAGRFVAALPFRGRVEARLGRVQCSSLTRSFTVYSSMFSVAGCLLLLPSAMLSVSSCCKAVNVM
jgi:hypothetical protein